MALINTLINSFDQSNAESGPRSAIFSDNNWGSEVEGFNLLNVKIHYSAEVIAAPVETGTKSFDNKVINPTRVVVTGKIIIGDKNWQKAVRAIEKMMADREYNFYSVCDGCNYAKNLILKECPIERNPSEFDFINIELVFVEALLIQSNGNTTSDSENSDCRNNGYINGVIV